MKDWHILSDDALRLFLALKDLTTNNETPMTLEGVCDVYGIPRTQALPAVKELVDKGFVVKGTGTLRLADEKRSVKFIKSSPDRLAQTEAELVQLKSQFKQRILGETSGLADHLPPEEKLFVIDLERLLGRGLTVNEAMLLGKCIQGWGIPRTRQLLKSKWDAENRFVVAYAIMSNGGRGKTFEGTKEKSPKYRERTRREE